MVAAMQHCKFGTGPSRLNGHDRTEEICSIEIIEFFRMTTSCPASSVGPAGLLFTSLIQSLFSSQCQLGNPNDYPRDYGDQFKNGEMFDFIVVGAGAAGSAVASRLAENPTFNILLLEAGGDPNPTSDIPLLLFDNIASQPDMIWHYESASNNYSCLSMRDQRCPLQQGKVLGGTTTINIMNFVRGNQQDFDDWESFGNKGWGYADVLPYFKKLENYGIDNEYHSSSGPMTGEYFGSTPNLDNLKKLMCDSYEEIGVAYNDDVNGERQVGCSIVPGTIINRTRANTAKMYLKNRTNLKVVKHALVEKIEIENGTAVGVIFRRKCKTFLAKVGKEIILSAGVVRSPQILMLSGVGPKEKLEKHGIAWKVFSPGVGKNLHDHLGYYGVNYNIKKENAGGITNITTNDAIYQYLQSRTGQLASILVSDTFAFVDTFNRTDVPDIQVHQSFLAIGGSQTSFRVLGFNDEVIQERIEALKHGDLWYPIPYVLQPKSRGEVLLKSADITDHPIIRMNYLSDPEDIEALIRGIELVKNATKAKSFSVLEPVERFIKIEACSKFDEDSREYLECQIRHLASGSYHLVGTCKMGPSTDPGAVVDNELSVYGVLNLRVVDCSIMPKITRGNTMIPAIMIAEKAADIIKRKWQ